MNKMIYRFEGQERFLQNDFEVPVKYEGNVYRNATAVYEASKSEEMRVRKQFKDLFADEARVLGAAVKLRDEWEDIKDKVLFEISLAKFMQNPDLAEQLVKTRVKYLVHGNVVHDNYLGFCLCSCCRNIHKQNRLGDVLMQVRDVLLEK